MTNKSSRFAVLHWILILTMAVPVNLHADESMTRDTSGSITKEIPASSSKTPDTGAYEDMMRKNAAAFAQSLEPSSPIGSSEYSNMMKASVAAAPTSEFSSDYYARMTKSGMPDRTGSDSSVPVRGTITKEMGSPAGNTGIATTPASNPGNQEIYVNDGQGHLVLANLNTTPNQFPSSTEGIAEGYVNDGQGHLVLANVNLYPSQFPTAEPPEGYHYVIAPFPPGTLQGVGLQLWPNLDPTPSTFPSGPTSTPAQEPNPDPSANPPAEPSAEPEPGGTLEPGAPPIEPEPESSPEPTPDPIIEIITRSVEVFVDGSIFTEDSFDTRDIPVRYRISGARVITDTWQVNADGTRVLLSSSGNADSLDPYVDCATSPCMFSLFQNVGSRNEMIGVIHSMTITGYQATPNPDDAVRFTVLGGNPIAYQGGMMGIDNQNRLFYEENFLAELGGPSGNAVQGTKRTFVGVYEDRSPAVDTYTLLRYKREFYVGLEQSAYKRQVAQSDEGVKFFPRWWAYGDINQAGRTIVYGNSPAQSARIESGEINRPGDQEFFPFDREITVEFTIAGETFDFNFKDIESTANVTVPISPRYHEPERSADLVTRMLVYPEINGTGFRAEIFPAIELTDVPASAGTLEVDKARVALATYFSFDPDRGSRDRRNRRRR